MKTFKLGKEDCRLLGNLLDVETDFKADNRQQKAAKRLLRHELSKGIISVKYKKFLITVLQFSIDRFSLVLAKLESKNPIVRLYRNLRFSKFKKLMTSSKASCEKLKDKIDKL